MDKKQPEWVRFLGLFGVIVTDLVAYTGAGVFLGYLAQTKLGAPAWVIAIGAAVGLALAMFRVYQVFKKLQG